MSDRAPTVLVFDSGIGGLTVFREIRALMPAAHYIYAGDVAVFPYGRLDESVLIERVVFVMERLIARFRPDVVVIACNTASTLVLPPLRARFAVPFVGTVPAVKPAAQLTRTGHIAVLATPGTVKRDYTRALISSFAASVTVELVGATRLAGLAERHLQGEAISDAEVLAEIEPCFTERDGRRTDVVALACTHYPLLVDILRRIAPWPVSWLDPAPAIARRTAQLAGPAPVDAADPGDALALFTSDAGMTTAMRAALQEFGLPRVEIDGFTEQAN